MTGTTMREYVLFRDDVGEEGLVQTLLVLVDLLRPRLYRGEIDAITGAYYEESVPPEARDAREKLRAIGARQAGRTLFLRRPRDGRVDIPLDLRDDSNLNLFVTFAPYSIFAAAYEEDCRLPVLSFMDTGDALSFRDESLVDPLLARSKLDRSAIRVVGR